MTQHSHEERIRLKAYEIWLLEGQPEGRDAYHWNMAREAIGHEDAYFSTLKPNPDSDEDVTDVGRPKSKSQGGKQSKVA